MGRTRRLCWGRSGEGVWVGGCGREGGGVRWMGFEEGGVEGGGERKGGEGVTYVPAIVLGAF